MNTFLGLDIATTTGIALYIPKDNIALYIRLQGDAIDNSSLYL